jgi:hypothetical protein
MTDHGQEDGMSDEPPIDVHCGGVEDWNVRIIGSNLEAGRWVRLAVTFFDEAEMPPVGLVLAPIDALDIANELTRHAQLAEIRDQGDQNLMTDQPSDLDEIVTFHGTAHDGAKLEIEMPRWAYDAIQRGQPVVWRGGSDMELLMGEEGDVTRRYPAEDF